MPDDIVKLSVNGTEFSGWEGLTITRSVDNCADAFSLSAPFNPDVTQLVEAFRPFGYQSATVKIDDELVLTGRIEASAASVSESDQTINVQGRSLTGSLIDCAIDGVGYEFSGLTLGAIANKVCQPFGVSVVVLTDSKKITEAKADPGQNVFDFLGKLAQDSGLLLSCDAQGRLVITKIEAKGAPVAALIQGQGPVKRVEGSFSGTQRFSYYKVLQQQDGAPSLSAKADDAGVKAYRPLISAGVDSDASDIQSAANWKRALALSEAVGVNVTLSGWRAPGGTLWEPGQLVTLKAPGAFILKEAPFIIAEAALALDASQGRTASLRLVLPATYTGELPGSYPWD